MDKKRGLVRIIEASISVVLIAGVLIFLFVNNASNNGVDLSEYARGVLEEIANNASLRTAVINYDNDTISNFVLTRLPSGYNFESRICGVNDICGKSNFTESEIFVGERVISATIDNFNPKKVKIFIWAK